MGLILDNVAGVEQAKYERSWADSRYRIKCHSLQLWNDHREWFPGEFKSALDIGCGLGLLLSEWNKQGIEAWGVDIADNCLDVSIPDSNRKFLQVCLWEMEWYLGYRFDFGICTDVMEHIPPEYVVETLRRIGQCCNEVLFKIAHEPNYLNGDTLHLTLRPWQWWLEQMGDGAKYLGTVTRSGCKDSIIRWRVQ